VSRRRPSETGPVSEAEVIERLFGRYDELTLVSEIAEPPRTGGSAAPDSVGRSVGPRAGQITKK
jgi:hypothetical protein